MKNTTFKIKNRYIKRFYLKHKTDIYSIGIIIIEVLILFKLAIDNKLLNVI